MTIKFEIQKECFLLSFDNKNKKDSVSVYPLIFSSITMRDAELMGSIQSALFLGLVLKNTENQINSLSAIMNNSKTVSEAMQIIKEVKGFADKSKINTIFIKVNNDYSVEISNKKIV